ncbi:nucleotidyl transferase AbiEii/AbiGii toxin family protein [Pararoseomonas sp. SCSIO 73927]|uniref:nucleotidyl transferase AbiEii/AbiGii toxin family protein n=1 Tax=Pararoseomonas sp. SCSIO 73927 TaxID=3114537 RepID=UPI0030D256DF
MADGTSWGGCPSATGGLPGSDDLAHAAAEIAITELGTSPYRARFPLHGAWAVGAWIGELPRPTQGIDLLDRGRGSADEVVEALQSALGPCPRGLLLDWADVRVRTKAARRSPLHRISIPAWLGRRRLDLRIDVTVARTAVSEIEFRPLRSRSTRSASIWAACCPAEEIVAEKAALLVTYGADHTRLQDVFDLRLLSRRIRFDGSALVDAMAAVFEGRDAARMLGRDDGYWQGAFNPRRVTPADEARWADLSGTAGPDARPRSLAATLGSLARFLVPVLQALRHGADLGTGWEPGTGWVATTARRPGRTWHPDTVARSDFRKAAIVMMGVGRK